ncbi:MAG TPA: polysaccharide deacetylase family protein [Cytophagales bacterium]|nr:polysaccharide deacetylase family protein [Cytophagales bacterium]
MLYPSLVWNRERNGKSLYLTFDDGPIPEVTEFVLEELKKFEAKATFFCVGENIKKNKAVFENIIADGHAVGNHSYNHLNGFKTPVEIYLENIKKCDSLLPSNPSGKKLFRPPYGRITRKQIQSLSTDYKIIMWDVLSGDFDKNLSPEKCYQAVIKYSKPGSIVVFHDNIKTYSTLRDVLPKVLKHFKEEGYGFMKM